MNEGDTSEGRFYRTDMQRHYPEGSSSRRERPNEELIEVQDGIEIIRSHVRWGSIRSYEPTEQPQSQIVLRLEFDGSYLAGLRIYGNRTVYSKSTTIK